MLDLKPLPTPTEDAVCAGKVRFRCTARSIDPKGVEAGGLWYKFSDENTEGWLHQDELTIFDTEAQAKSSRTSDRYLK